MDYLSRAVSLTLGAALVATALSTNSPCAPLAAQTHPARSIVTPQAVNHQSSAEAGIKLLEQILSKLKNLPQLALKQKPLLIAQNAPQQQQLQNSSSNQLDWMLAIKPPTDKARNARKRSAIKEKPLEIASSYGAGTENYSPAASENRSLVNEKAMLYQSPLPVQVVDDRPIARDFRQMEQSTTSKSAEDDSASRAKKVEGSPNFWTADTAKSVEPRRGIDQFATSMNNITKAGTSLQGRLQGTDRPIAKSFGAHQHYEHYAAGALSKTAPTMGLESMPVSIAKGDGTTEYESAADAKDSFATAQGASNAAAGVAGAPPPPPSIAAASPAPFSDLAPGTVTPQQPSKYKYTHEYTPEPITKMATVVPTVISGIPLVHLGANATEATRALKSTRGATTMQRVQKWTVVSAKKPGTQDTAIQLYIDHGIVEAIRVFDTSLIPSDLGVAVGDQLTTLKTRFGEPAFILSEPDRGHGGIGGQNYIYPISQIGFQLARDSSSNQPKVVSLMIFNVK